MNRTLYYLMNYGFYIVVSYKKEEHLKYWIRVDKKNFNIDALNINEINTFHVEPICEPDEYPKSTKLYITTSELIDLINNFKNKS